VASLLSPCFKHFLLIIHFSPFVSPRFLPFLIMAHVSSCILVYGSKNIYSSFLMSNEFYLKLFTFNMHNM
jgi:hypothetical protein